MKRTSLFFFRFEELLNLFFNYASLLTVLLSLVVGSFFIIDLDSAKLFTDLSIFGFSAFCNRPEAILVHAVRNFLKISEIDEDFWFFFSMRCFLMFFMKVLRKMALKRVTKVICPITIKGI